MLGDEYFKSLKSQSENHSVLLRILNNGYPFKGSRKKRYFFSGPVEARKKNPTTNVATKFEFSVTSITYDQS